MTKRVKSVGNDGPTTLNWAGLLYRSIYPFLYSDSSFRVSLMNEIGRLSEIVVSGRNVTASTVDTLSIKHEKTGLRFLAFWHRRRIIPTYIGSLGGQL